MARLIPSSRRGKWLLAAAVAAVAAAAYLALSVYIVNESLVAERNPIEERPEEYGLAYEDVEFAPRGWPEITLRGWWLPAEDAKGVVIRAHGVDRNRAELLGLAAALVEDGYSVLTFDLRGHGESDPAQMGAGLHERDDVLGALDYAIRERGAEPGRVLLHGNSYGGAIALLAGAEECGAAQERGEECAVAGVFADSSFAALPDLIVQEVARRTPVGSWGASALRPGIALMARLTKGIDVNAVRPEEAAAVYDYPLGLAHCEEDERIGVRHLWRIRSALRAPHLVVTIYPDCGHNDAWDDFPEQYESRLLYYFDERLGEL